MTIDPFHPLTGAPFDSRVVRAAIKRFLEEDVGTGDLTTSLVVPPGANAVGTIVAREPCVVAGLMLAEAVFRELDPTVSFEQLTGEGEAVATGARIARVRGPARPILTGERLALNLLQRLSGVATVTRRHVDAVAGTGVSVSDTRKTTPGLRLFEKYAVRMGGGRNHRLGLHDGILIKDNHVAAAGGIAEALRATRAGRKAPGPVQIEVDSLEQLDVALDIGVDAVLLDNLPPDRVAAAVARIRARPGGASLWIEASGGITLANIRAYAEAGVDTISVGALTHSARAIDIALDFNAVSD